MTDPYLQSDGTLKNKPGFTDAGQLSRYEFDKSVLRGSTLAHSGALAHTGFERLKAIHAHLFGAVYDWAGQPRTVAMGKREYVDSGRIDTFTAPGRIPREAERIFGQALAAGYFKGLSRVAFAAQAADHFGAINQLHAFREGNGRAQRAYIESVAQEAGHTINTRGISKERMIVVCRAFAQGDPSPMRELFEDITDPVQSAELARAGAFLEAQKQALGVHWHDLLLLTAKDGQRITGTFVARGGEQAIILAASATRDSAGQSFVLVNAHDVPTGKDGQALECNDSLRMTHTLTHAQAAQRWLDRIDQAAAPGARQAALEADWRALEGLAKVDLTAQPQAAPNTVAAARHYAIAVAKIVRERMPAAIASARIRDAQSVPELIQTGAAGPALER